MASEIYPNAWIGYQAALSVTPKDYGATFSQSATGTAGTAFRLRATNVGLQVKQNVQYPELIDAAVDNTAYQLEAQIVEGDISFPLIHEGSALSGLGSTKNQTGGCGTTYTSMASQLWTMAASRQDAARLRYASDIRVVYPDNSDFVYPGCLINTLKFSVRQNASVDVTFGLVGGTDANRDTRVPTSGSPGMPTYLSPARIVTWNDFVLSVFSSDGESGVISNTQYGYGVREFEIELKNNVDRYFTFNGTLRPQDITAKKRELSGSFKMMGRNRYINNLGETNENRYTSDENIAFGYMIGSNNIYWSTVLHGVIFNFEEMTITPGEVFETTVPFRATGDCGFDYEATALGTNGAGGGGSGTGVQGLGNSGVNATWGGDTRSSWPTASVEGTPTANTILSPFGNDWGDY